jgi:hypothetical protein
MFRKKQVPKPIIEICFGVGYPSEPLKRNYTLDELAQIYKSSRNLRKIVKDTNDEWYANLIDVKDSIHTAIIKLAFYSELKETEIYLNPPAKEKVYTRIYLKTRMTVRD